VTVRVVALDDYRGLVGQYALAGRPDGADWAAVREHLDGEALVRALDGAAVIVAMRERTRFGRDLFARLPGLKLLITTGMRNAAIDLQAADHG
jgi:phosphoglycerate dehydrogenase-like enzyme